MRVYLDDYQKFLLALLKNPNLIVSRLVGNDYLREVNNTLGIMGITTLTDSQLRRYVTRFKAKLVNEGINLNLVGANYSLDDALTSRNNMLQHAERRTSPRGRVKSISKVFKHIITYLVNKSCFQNVPFAASTVRDFAAGRLRIFLNFTDYSVCGYFYGVTINNRRVNYPGTSRLSNTLIVSRNGLRNISEAHGRLGLDTVVSAGVQAPQAPRRRGRPPGSTNRARAGRLAARNTSSNVVSTQVTVAAMMALFDQISDADRSALTGLDRTTIAAFQ